MNDHTKSKLKFPEIVPEGTLRDFLLPIVEFLGILVPGLLFLLIAIPALVIPCTYALTFVIKGTSVALDLFDYVIDIMKSSSIGVAGIVLVASYVAGHIFYRQDPKIPDEHSFNKVKKLIEHTGPVRHSEAEYQYNVKHDKVLRKLSPDRYNLEFPYRYLGEYLTDRGMFHLASMIHWRGMKPETYAYRTKHFINGLKARLEFVFPYQYTRIQRNEAHVRLMSSLWYATRSLQVLSAFGIIISLVFMLTIHEYSNNWWPIPEINAVAAPAFSFLLVYLVRSQIEDFLHYQRIREIVYILEISYFATKLYPDMFEGIIGERGIDS